MTSMFEAWRKTLSDLSLLGERDKIDPGEVDYIVNSFFLADNIDPQAFLSNLEYLLTEGMGTPLNLLCGNKDKGMLRRTKSVSAFCPCYNRPRGYPLWFLAGYPDAAIWLQNMMHRYIEMHGRDYDGWGRVSLGFFGVNPDDPNLRESDMFDDDDRYRARILRNLVQSYRDKTRKNLEVRSKGIWHLLRIR